MRSISVRLLPDGLPALVITGRGDLDQLVAVLDRLNTTHVWRGGEPIASAVDFIGAARAAMVLIDTTTPVPGAEPNFATGGVGAESWITTKEAADTFGITPRAIRKRVATGALSGRKVGGVLLINTLEIDPHAA